MTKEENPLGIEVLLGKTIIEIELKRTYVSEDDRKQGDILVFSCSDKSIYEMYHSQDCCEEVYIEDITGDLQDLIGSPILKAEECTNDNYNEKRIKEAKPHFEDDFLWTFYKLATIKGYVDIRWFGCSNGYYAVDVEFVERKND